MNFESQIFDYFKSAAFELGFDFEPMYQSPNPGELYGMVTNRIAAGKPCIFCRIVDIPVNAQDTHSDVLNGTIQVELIIAQVPLDEFEPAETARGVYQTRTALINEIRQKSITLEPDPRPSKFRFTSLGRSLFRDNNIDALALNCFRNIVVDFDEIYP